MLAGVLLMLVLSQDGNGFRLRKYEMHDLQKMPMKSSMSKILGGSRAEYGEFPFIVSLQVLGKLHFCGGSVISNNWLVTANHCVEEPSFWEFISVRAGSLTNEEGGTVHNIEKIIMHPDYSITSLYDSDIALIKVKQPFSTNEYVQPVLLGKKKDIPETGTDVVTAGWGITSRKDDLSDNDYDDYESNNTADLLKVTLQALDNEKCDNSPAMERIRSSFPTVKINDNVLCAVAEDKDTTSGDSGGPLLKYNADGKEPRLVGVVSWGEGIGQLDSPGVYTNVANFIQWIYLMTVTLPK